MGTFIKTLIVVNLIASLVFAVIVLVLYANRMEWKEKYLQQKAVYVKSTEEWTKSWEDAKTDRARLITELTGAVHEKNAAVEDLEKSRTEVKNKDIEINERKAEGLKKDDIIGAKENTIVDLQKKNDSLISQNNQYKQEAEVAKNNESEAVQEATRLQTVVTQMRLQGESLQKQLGRANSSIEEKDYLITRVEKVLGRTATEIIVDGEMTSEPLQPIAAKVIVSLPDENLVVLSVGEKDKVKVGYKFTVYRGDVYLGRVEVIELHPNMSSARVLVELNNDKGIKMERGDDAKTRL